MIEDMRPRRYDFGDDEPRMNESTLRVIVLTVFVFAAFVFVMSIYKLIVDGIIDLK
jgi:hypothetical protein